MEQSYLGKLIAYERKKKKISLAKLSSGVLTHTGLKRLEDGERFPSFFIMERIVERLARSMNKLELLLHEKDYEIYYLRGKIEKEVEQKEWEKANQSISYYESLPVIKEVLHYQYVCKMKAVISCEKKEGKKALKLLEEALKSTLIWWENIQITEGEFPLDDILEEYPIGKEEIILLLMWLWQMWEEGKSVRINGKKLLSLLTDYFQEDEEERAALLSKVCWVLGSLSLKQGKEEEAYFFTQEGESVLAKNRILLYLPQYLDRLVMIGEKIDDLETEGWRRQRDALKEVFISYGRCWETEEIPIWKNLKLTDIYLLSEFLEKERRVCIKSQQEIAFDLEIDPKTISRLERGHYKPKTETFQKIRDYYKIARDVCSTRLITEDFHLLEMEREVSVYHHLNCHEEAEKLYLTFRNKLDLSWKVNKQFVLYQDMICSHQLGRIGHEEALEQCKKAFHVTRPNVSPENVDRIILSRGECMIINYMGICYRKMGQIEKTIDLLEKARWGYRNSKIDSKYYYMTLGLLYSNLVEHYELSNRFEEAMNSVEVAIHYELDCNKCSDLGYLISMKQYIADRSRGSFLEEGKKVYQQSFQLMKLMKRELLMDDLKNGYREWYGEELI